jgi:hypothetical protein
MAPPKKPASKAKKNDAGDVAFEAASCADDVKNLDQGTPQQQAQKKAALQKKIQTVQAKVNVRHPTAEGGYPSNRY